MLGNRTAGITQDWGSLAVCIAEDQARRMMLLAVPVSLGLSAMTPTSAGSHFLRQGQNHELSSQAGRMHDQATAESGTVHSSCLSDLAFGVPSDKGQSEREIGRRGAKKGGHKTGRREDGIPTHILQRNIGLLTHANLCRNRLDPSEKASNAGQLMRPVPCPWRTAGSTQALESTQR